MSTKNVILGGSAVIAILLAGALLVTGTIMQFGISEEEATTIALATVLGTVQEVELENVNSNPVYEIDIEKDGKEFEVTIDAESGEVKSVEEEEDLGKKPEGTLTGHQDGRVEQPQSGRGGPCSERKQHQALPEPFAPGGKAKEPKEAPSPRRSKNYHRSVGKKP